MLPILLSGVIVLTSSPLLMELTVPQEFIAKEPRGSAVLLIFIDFADFNCPACADSLLDFCRTLPPRSFEKEIWGIVCTPWEGNGNGVATNEDLLKKKIRGFVQANNVRFPVILAKTGAVTACSRNGSFVVIIDPVEKQILSFKFPLASEEIQKIHSIL